MSSLKLTANIGIKKIIVVKSTAINILIIIYIITLLVNSTTAVSCCYTRMSVGFFIKYDKLQRWV